MRKFFVTFLSLLTLLVSVFSLSSCREEKDEPVKPQEEDLVFTPFIDQPDNVAGFGGMESSRAGISGKFATGDLIGIFVYEKGKTTPKHSNIAYRYNGTIFTPVNAGTAIKIGGVALDIFYYYPYVNTNTTATAVRGEALQHTTIENWEKSDFLYGASKSVLAKDVSLRFKHAYSTISVDLTKATEVKTVVIKNVQFSTTWKATGTGTEITALTPRKDIQLYPHTIGDNAKYRATLPVQKLTSAQPIVITYKNGKILTLKPDNELQLIAGKIHHYGTSLSANITINQATGGTTTGGGDYFLGQDATLTATPATGYIFKGWKLPDGSIVSPASPYTFKVVGNLTLTPVFEKQKITITVQTATGGTTTGAGTYDYGTKYTLRATAATGYGFKGWKNEQGTIESSANPWESTATRNRTFIPVFEKGKITISYSKNSNIASISKTSEVIEYGGTSVCVATLPPNTAQYTYTFDGWYEGNNRVRTTTELKVLNNTYSRSFEARGIATVNKYTITVPSVPGGTTTGAGTYNYGASCSLKATASAGYTFKGWKNEAGVLGTTVNPYTFTVTSNRTLTPVFEANKYTITYVKAAGIASISKTSEVVSWGANATGCTATLTNGYTFDGWYNGATKVSTSLTYAPTSVKSNLTLTAKAVIKSHTVAVAAYYRDTNGTGNYRSGTTGGTVSGGGTVNHGGNITVTASPAVGYKFDGWFSAGETGGSLLSSSLSYTVANVTYPLAVYARFTKMYYTITVPSVPGGTTTGAGTYAHGASCSLRATASAGYTFKGWKNEVGVLGTTANPYVFTVTQNRTLTPVFEKVAPTYTFTFADGSTTFTMNRTSSDKYVLTTPISGFKSTKQIGSTVSNVNYELVPVEIRWITNASLNGGQLRFTIEKNDTSADRTGYVILRQAESNKTIRVVIHQPRGKSIDL